MEIKEFSVIIEKDAAGFFVASVPSLRGCHTQAKSLDTLIKSNGEAIELCLEVETPTSMNSSVFKKWRLTHDHVSINYWQSSHSRSA